MPTYRLTPQASAEGCVGGSFAYGPLSRTFDVTKALEDGGGSFFTDNQEVINLLNSQWANTLEVVSDQDPSPEVEDEVVEPAPDPPTKIFGRPPVAQDVAAVHEDDSDGDS